MDKEVWMAEMSKDADRRAEDRKVRKEKADTQNTMAIKAFRRGDYQKALSCYNRAIDYIKDNPMFYCDRALTNIKLNNYDKVILNNTHNPPVNIFEIAGYKTFIDPYFLLVACMYVNRQRNTFISSDELIESARLILN